MKRPESREAQQAAIKAYHQAYEEVATLIEDIRGKDVMHHRDHYAGLWCAAKMTLVEGHTPWQDEEQEAVRTSAGTPPWAVSAKDAEDYE